MPEICEVAVIADQITALKNQGQNTVAALARGLDSLKQIGTTHTGMRLQTIRTAMSRHEEPVVGAILSLLAAVGCLLIAFATSSVWFFFSIFCFAIAVAFMLPVVWDIMTER